MGHMLKNTVFKSGSYALGVPAQSTGVRPSPAVLGQTRFNTDIGKLEFYANIGGSLTWHSVAKEGNVDISKTGFSGDGTTRRWGPLKNSYSSGQEAQVLVHVGTVYQIPGTNYEFYGNTTIGFISPPSGGSDITIIEGLASTISTLA